jgi:quinol-cytochrome oxidoreductase complex cytochrome b subunit
MKNELKRVAMDAPLNAIEERTGLVGYHNWFLFRNVPKGISWLHTLGFCLLVVFVSQTITGVILAMYYQPSADTAYESIVHITAIQSWGWLVRGMHKWGASMMIILLFLHMAAAFIKGSYKYPRELTWISGVLIFALMMGMGFTGYLLVWDNRAYWASVVGININGTGPIIGPYLAQFFKGDAQYTGQILSRFYSIHMLQLPLALGGLITLHMYLVTKLGVQSAPWAKDDPANDPEAWS